MTPDEREKSEVEPDKHETRNSSNNEISFPLHRKLLLNAVMTGNEVCVAFQHLYEVPLLQVLGVPVTYVSLYPLVTGPAAMLLLNLQGYLCDKGPHHRQRKMVAVACNSAVILLGIGVLIVANLLFLYNQGDHRKDIDPAERNHSLVPDENLTIVTKCSYDHNLLKSMNITPTKNSSIEDMSAALETNLDTGVFSSDENVSIAVSQEQQEDIDRGLTSTPITVLLGLVGFCAMDIGYDANIAASRSFVLSCSPKADHTSVLVLALVMAAVGGLINNVFGIVDLRHVFDFGGAEEG